jgi:hypothetical protein
MKKKKVISKLLATAALSTFAVATFAQNDLGKNCGCPPVSSRGTPVAISSLPGFSGGRLTQGATLTCDKIYSLDVRVHVPAGQTLKIAPGTVIKGKPGTSPATETALIVERGGMIDACGSSDCPIVFTADADPMDNTYGLDNIGKWGGIVILGKATNNLTLSCNGPAGSGKLAVQDGLGTIEGFNAPADSKYWFGADVTHGESFNDNDNSGTLKYVSIRHAGAILEVGNEINALTLGSVGRGTTLDHIDIVSCADDGIEFFGGTVNLKYASVLFGNDDMFDWDLGYSGKAQFLFGMKATTATSVDSDNGFEGDSDDNKCKSNVPRSKPVIYNATIIGNAKTTKTVDNSAIAGFNAKEDTYGEIHNSIFTDFKNGFNLVNASPSPDALQEWTAGNLIFVCNTLVNCTNDFTVGEVLVPALPDANRTKFATTDKNQTIATAASIGMVTPFANGSPAVDANPTLQNVTGCPVAPTDGFFSTAAYRGAFSPTGKNWLSEWSSSAIKSYIIGTQPCPTDVTGDGQTTNADLSQILLEFGKACK